MSRMVAFLCAFSLSSMAHAELPAAPLNPSSAQEIANEFRDCCEDDYKDDVSRVPKMPGGLGSEQAYVYAKYMNEAFERAGYSLDKTLLSYYKSERIVPVVMFMSRLNLEGYATSLKNKSIGAAFEKAGAVNKDTVSYARDIAWEIPIENPDYTISADPNYVIEGLSVDYRRERSRMVGYVRKGVGPWKGWLYLDWVSAPGEEKGTGLAADDDTGIGPAERRIWNELVNKKIKLEGTRFQAVGVTLAVPESSLRANDPGFIDKKYPLVIKIL